MKMKDWLADFATEYGKKVSKKMTRTASAKQEKVEAPKTDNAQLLLMDHDALPGVRVGNTVKYNNQLWKVVDTKYKDAVGPAVALQRVAEISDKKVTDAPERAAKDPGNVYDYEVREVSEIPDFQEAAERTEKEIARDRAHDFTTPAGRTSNPEPIAEENPFADIVEPAAEESAAEDAAVEEPAVAEEPAAEEAVVEEPAAEEAAEEVAVEEPAAAEEPVAEEKEEEAGAFDDLIEDKEEEDKKPVAAAKEAAESTIAEKVVKKAAEKVAEKPVAKKVAEKKIAKKVAEKPVKPARKPLQKKAIASEKPVAQKKASIYETNPILRKIIASK